MTAELINYLQIISVLVTVLLVSMLGFAAVMKSRDIAGLAQWFEGLRVGSGRTLATILVMLDGMLMSLLMLALIGAATWWLASSAIAVVLLGGRALRRYAGRPCPCIGDRHGRWAGSFAGAMALFAGLDFVIRFAGVAEPVDPFWGWTLLCVAGAAGGSAALFLDRRVMAGESVNLPPEDWLSVWMALQGVAEKNSTLIILFASVSCAGCTRALEQLSEFSPKSHHRIFVDVGRRLPGVASVAGLQVANVDPSVRRMLDVAAIPCLLVLRQGEGARWIGERQVSGAITNILKLL